MINSDVLKLFEDVAIAFTEVPVRLRFGGNPDFEQPNNSPWVDCQVEFTANVNTSNCKRTQHGNLVLTAYLPDSKGQVKVIRLRERFEKVFKDADLQDIRLLEALPARQNTISGVVYDSVAIHFRSDVPR